MHLFFDEGMGGGTSQVATPWVEANHEGYGEKFDREFKRSYIAMFDRNNQYGWAMSQYLPTHGFKCVQSETTSPEFWSNYILK